MKNNFATEELCGWGFGYKKFVRLRGAPDCFFRAKNAARISKDEIDLLIALASTGQRI